MVKTFDFVLVFATALCFSSLLGSAFAHNYFEVQGQLYCDTCRVQFVTRLIEFLPNSTVAVECRDRYSEIMTFNTTGTTDERGFYNIVVEGNHEEEICEVVAISSSNPDCQDRMDVFERARVVLTTNVGISEDIRYANPIGFLKTKALSECAQVLEELGFKPIV